MSPSSSVTNNKLPSIPGIPLGIDPALRPILLAMKERLENISGERGLSGDSYKTASQTDAELDAIRSAKADSEHSHDYLSIEEINGGVADARYYTQDQLNDGSLDLRYFTQEQVIQYLEAQDEFKELKDVPAMAGAAGKPVVINPTEDGIVYGTGASGVYQVVTNVRLTGAGVLEKKTRDITVDIGGRVTTVSSESAWTPT